MELHNSLTIDSTKFGATAITDEVGAQKHRQMRIDGLTPLPMPHYLESAEQLDIPSRDSGKTIPCRILRPQNGSTKGVYIHFHSGGWVLGDEKTQDVMLQDLANKTNILAFSVGYRLAPEYPFPAGPKACCDAAEWLIDNAESQFGARLEFCGGESAGAHLAVLVMLHLLQSPEPRYASHQLRGMILNFSCYNMLWSPSVHNFKKPKTLILGLELMEKYAEAFLPDMSDAEKKHPSVSPLYADFDSLRGRLPPAVFTVGTEDCLIDDTIFMSAKWMMAGGEATVKVIPGAAHAYITFPRNVKGSGADEGG